jgi:hypothetical protein
MMNKETRNKMEEVRKEQEARGSCRKEDGGMDATNSCPGRLRE